MRRINELTRVAGTGTDKGGSSHHWVTTHSRPKKFPRSQSQKPHMSSAWESGRLDKIIIKEYLPAQQVENAKPEKDKWIFWFNQGSTSCGFLVLFLRAPEPNIYLSICIYGRATCVQYPRQRLLLSYVGRRRKNTANLNLCHHVCYSDSGSIFRWPSFPKQFHLKSHFKER